MKRTLILLLLLLLLLSGCKAAEQTASEASNSIQSEAASNITLEVEETAYNLADAAQFATSYNADISFLQKEYGFKETDATKYKVLFGTMQDANRLALFEVANDTQRKAVHKVVEAMHKQLSSSFTTELSEQKTQAEQAQTMEQGNYILFISGAYAQAGADAFTALFQAK